MATFVRFDSLTEALAGKVHDLGNDSLKVMLTNSAPSSANTVKADIAEISAGGGYTAGGIPVTVASSFRSGATYKLVLDDIVLTAAGGTVGPFRYAVLYNDTATNDELIGYWDRGVSVTLEDTDTVTLDLDPSAGILTLG